MPEKIDASKMFADVREIKRSVDAISDLGRRMLLRSFVELVEKSDYGEKHAEIVENFSILEKDGSGICALLDYHNLIIQLAEILFQGVGYFSFVVRKIEFSGGSYMRTARLTYDPNGKGMDIKIPIN